VVVDPIHVHFSTLEQLVVSRPAAQRLLMSCAMGGLVGIEREWRQKDSGLRTNMLICMGSALFTIMSEVLAGDSTPNKGQVAANIVQGVGFLGAGLILHAKTRVLGLTSAATVFVVAAIGMTCGAGLYLVALVATALVLVALQLVGIFEMKLAWKRYPMIYEVRADVGSSPPSSVVGEDKAEAMAEDVAAALHRMQRTILKVLDGAGQRLSVLERDNVAGMERVAFTVIATKHMHERMLHELRESDATDQVVAFRDTEEE
jgi:putative Mg2+ transporter-C (MgtC) family protein